MVSVPVATNAFAEDAPERRVVEEEDDRLYVEATTNDPRLGSLWALDAIGAKAAWDVSKANGSVTVALLDTGVDTDHPDLVANLILDDYARNTHTDETGRAAVEDSFGHGTHAAGIIAGVANNGVGVAGVSYNARILPIKVSYGTEGDISSSDVIKALDYVATIKNDSESPDYIRNTRVINMSFGGYTYSENYQKAITRAHEAGILLIGSAGNKATNRAHYPSSYDHVVSVSALYKRLFSTIEFDSSYSNDGPYVDIAGPETSILSTEMGGGYGSRSGTSSAAPVVAGAAALVYAINMGATPDDVEQILLSTADDKGDAGRDDMYGCGALRVDKAVGVRAMSSAYVEPVPDQVYAAEALTPQPVVMDNGKQLMEGVDYTLSYNNNTEVGTATVVIEGKGVYKGRVVVEFHIVDPVQDGWVTLGEGQKGLMRDCKLVTGWMELDGAKYWFGEDGAMAVGWTDVEVNGTTMHCYFNPASGNLVRNTWFQIDGRTYYFRPSGNLATGWATIADNGVDKKYYLDEDGQLLTGWQDIEVNGNV